MALNEYLSREYSSKQARFGRILLFFGRIQRVESRLVEKVFFREEIGDIRMETLVENIFLRS